MNKTLKYLMVTGVILLVLFLVWYFSEIVAYILIAALLSMLGRPLLLLIEKISFGRFKIPRTISTALALLIMVSVIALIIMTFAPLIAKQARVLQNISIDSISMRYQQEAKQIESVLKQYGLIPPGITMEDYVDNKLKKLMELVSFPDIISRLVGFTGSLFIGIFSVLFISFFIWKDERLIFKAITLWFPRDFHDEIGHILEESRRLLSRYFLGLLLEISAMISLISLGLTIAGVENALLIGLLGGMMNIIPYLGPLIGAGIGVFLGLTSALGAGVYTGLPSLCITIIIVFSICKVLDDIFLQPIIYSNSVKAHPLEIFLVIMMAGTAAGIPGMILAIPIYTVIRIIIREFFGNNSIVQKLTKNM